MTDPMHLQDKTGKPFERLCAAVQRHLDGQAVVEWDAKVQGKSGVTRQIDVAIRGRRGSAKLFIAVEAKDYGRKLDIELVEAFIAKLVDIGAHKGIIVTSTGYERGALLRAREAGIDTCVLRPAKDEDWDGYLRDFLFAITTNTLLYEDAEIELADGRKVQVSPHGMEILKERRGRGTFFDYVVNSWLADHKWEEGQRLCLKTEPPLLYKYYEDDEDADPVEVSALRVTPRYVDGFEVGHFFRRPEDWIFVQQTPDGDCRRKALLRIRRAGEARRPVQDEAALVHLKTVGLLGKTVRFSPNAITTATRPTVGVPP